jgi:hypothetical protein
MTVARSVADVLAEHVQFEVDCIDRMYLKVWVPPLAYGGGVAGFFVGHRGHVYASTVLMDPMVKAFVADIHGFVSSRGLELVHFGKGQRKDDITQQVLATFGEEEGVLFVGRASGEVRGCGAPSGGAPDRRAWSSKGANRRSKEDRFRRQPIIRGRDSPANGLRGEKI